MRCFDWSRRIMLAAAAIAAAAGCKGPDPTGFSCSSSAECPGGYHCDLGTAAAAGSNKCASGAPAQKTLTVDATRFLLVKAPGPDGATRTTIEASLGAVTATPDFVGVRVIATQGGADLASSQVLSDGSILKFQLPQATAQVGLRVQDDSGHSVTVDKYKEQVELGFAGKEVAGNSNGAQAFDVTTQNDGVFNPATWISAGPGPGGRAKEFAATDTLDGGVVVASSSYASIAYADYETASTTSPPIPSFGSFSPPDAGTPVAWQPFNALPTVAAPNGSPAARSGAAITPTFSGFFLYGGIDAANNPIDAPGSFQTYDLTTGWTLTNTTLGTVPVSRSGAALGRQANGGSCVTNGFIAPCDFDTFPFAVTGGQNAAGVMTGEIVVNVIRSSFTNFSLPPTVSKFWVRLPGTLPFANAGMQSAGGYVPFNAVVSGANTSQVYAGGMLIYGRAVTAANSATQGCVLFGGAPQNAGSTGATVPAPGNAVSCVGSPSAFDSAATNLIGIRTGATLIADPNPNPTVFYLFGGRQATGATTTTLKNDIWQATVTCTAAIPGNACPTVTTWTQLSAGGAGTAFPSARAGAGGAFWSQGRLVIHGGTDVTGNLADLWEFDFTAKAWRAVNVDTTAGILSPPGRTGFQMVGDLGQNQIFAIGGTVTGGSLTDQLWLTARESAAKLLLKLPLSLPVIDQAQNLRITVDSSGNEGEQVFIWDGSTWRFIGATDFSSSVPHIVTTPTASAQGFLQADGNIYLLLIQTQRNQFTFTGFNFQGPVTADRVKATISFQ